MWASFSMFLLFCLFCRIYIATCHSLLSPRERATASGSDKDDGPCWLWWEGHHPWCTYLRTCCIPRVCFGIFLQVCMQSKQMKKYFYQWVFTGIEKREKERQRRPKLAACIKDRERRYAGSMFLTGFFRLRVRSLQIVPACCSAVFCRPPLDGSVSGQYFNSIRCMSWAGICKGSE